MNRLRIELALAGFFGITAAATLLWPTWIEQLTGLEPDAGSGETEWWLVTLLALAAIASAGLAIREKRTLQTRSAPGG